MHLEIGIALICLGWLLQLSRSGKEICALSESFLLLYSAGGAFAVAYGFENGLAGAAAIGTISILLTALIFFKVRKLKKGRKKK